MEACKRLILPLLALALLAACLPEPDDPLEYVESEDAVIVQKRTLIQDQDGACRLPEFTLYGDGTLLFRERNAGGGYTTPPAGVLQVHLSSAEIVDLLESVTDGDFLELSYDQPGPEIHPLSRRLAFIYVNTKGAANAVRVVSLRDGRLPEESGEFEGAERVLEAARLIDDVGLGFSAGDYTAFESPGALLVVRPTDDTVPSEAREWRGAINLAEVAPGSGVVEVRLEGTDAASIRSGTVTQDGRVFSVCVRPLLPFEENFPEFDTP